MRGGCGGRALRVVRDFNFIPRQPERIVSGRAFIQRVLSFSLLAIALAFSCVPADAADTIKVGAIVSATGPAAFLGDPEEKTLHAYVDSINASGGIAGRQIELFIYDDSSDAAKANSFAKRLIQQDNVDFIIGASTTGSTMAFIQLVETSKVPMLALGAGSVIVEPIRKFVFRMPHSDRLAAQKVLDHMKRHGITSFALLSDTGGYGKSGRNETRKMAASMGLTIPVDETYGERDTDMTPLLTHVKQSDAQAILMFGTGQAPAIIAKNSRQLGMTIPLYASHGQASYEFIRLAGAAGEGMLVPSPALFVADQLPDSDPQKAICLAYKKDFESRFKLDVSTFGGYAYDGLMIGLDAITRAGSLDKEKVRDAIEATKGFVGISGIYNMSPVDHGGLDESALRMVQIKDGKFVEIK
jgi:branched-chain amino acid transport system substrate-binding protein